MGNYEITTFHGICSCFNLITICGVHILLPENKKYQVRFTAEEVEIIERIRKKYNLNVNQFIRKSVMFAVENAEYENLVLTDPEFMKMMKIIRDESEKIMSKPQTVKHIERKLGAGKISQESLDRLESTASDIEKEIKKLKEKKNPGRKKTRKKPGRPKDKGR